MRLAVWSPLPPAPSGIADYVAETLPGLAERFDVVAVVEDPGAVDRSRLPPGLAVVGPAEATGAELDLYHVGNSPPHAYVHRRAVEHPGVCVLHDWCLHHLVLRETVEAGHGGEYLREMRRSYGEKGTFVARQVARGLGGDVLPARFPLNDRLLDASVALVGLSGWLCTQARLRRPDLPVLHLPHHLALPLDPLPGRAEARRALDLPQDALLVTAPGLATVSKRLDVVVGAIASLRGRHPGLRLVVAGAVDPALLLERWAQDAGVADALIVTGRVSIEDFVRHLVAADVVVGLRFPSHGEMSGALVRAMGVGRACLVSAGTPAAEEFGAGLVVPVDPSLHEAAELEAQLGELLADAALRERIGALAAAHVRAAHALDASLDRLAGFVAEAAEGKTAAVERWQQRRPREGSLYEYLVEEVRWSANELGLHGYPLGLPEILGELTQPGPGRNQDP